MRRIAVLTLLLPLAAFGCPGTAADYSSPEKDAETNPPDATTDATTDATIEAPIRVVNWNVKNLYNDIRDSPEVKVEDEIILTTADYQSKLGDIINVLGNSAPDVVVLQEIENEAVLNDIASKLLAAGAGDFASRFVTLGNDPRGIDIAVLAKKQLGGLEATMQVGLSHKQELFEASTDPGVFHKFARDVAEAHFFVAGRHLALLGIHLKAQDGDPESDHKRLAEAEQTGKIAHGILMQDPSAALVVAGDFNDTPGSMPLEALRKNDPPLESVTIDLPAAERYSVTYGGNPELFDDQLANAKAGSLLDPGSVVIVHTGAVNTASDHDPVAATYVLR